MHFKRMGIAVLCLLFMLAGCGGGSGEPTASQTAAPSAEAAATSTPEPTPEETPTPEATPEPSVSQEAPSTSEPAETESAQPTETASAGQIITYKEGILKVGTDIPAGEYFAVEDSGSIMPSLTVRDGSGSDAKILAVTVVENFSIIEVSDEEYLDVSGCTLFDISHSKEFTDAVIEKNEGGYPAGMYKVGFHIPAGEYKVVALKNAVMPSYTIYADATRQSIKDVKLVEGQGYVTLKDGEYIDLAGASMLFQAQ